MSGEAYQLLNFEAPEVKPLRLGLRRGLGFPLKGSIGVYRVP